jgi:hypothetical protein
MGVLDLLAGVCVWCVCVCGMCVGYVWDVCVWRVLRVRLCVLCLWRVLRPALCGCAALCCAAAAPCCARMRALRAPAAEAGTRPPAPAVCTRRCACPPARPPACVRRAQASLMGCARAWSRSWPPASCRRCCRLRAATRRTKCGRARLRCWVTSHGRAQGVSRVMMGCVHGARACACACPRACHARQKPPHQPTLLSSVT